MCAHYNSEQLVCPPNLRSYIFTVAAGDNIDHNLSSNTAQSSFHGTAISLIQFSTLECPGTDRHICQYSELASDKVSSIKLPDIYTEVPPCILPSTDPVIPSSSFSLPVQVNNQADYSWLNKVLDAVNGGISAVNVTWAAYNAETCIQQAQTKPILSILPLFKKSAHTPAMIRHTFNVVATATNRVNPGQTPLLTFDQPLYALAKKIQWNWPNNYGEDKFVIIVGGLHIEMASIRMLGHWLDGSGWVELLSKSNVYSAGVAASCIHASHVKKSRYAHAVTAAALYICLRREYAIFIAKGDQQCDSSILTFS